MSYRNIRASLALAVGLSAGLVSASALAVSRPVRTPGTVVIIADVEHGLGLLAPDSLVPEGLEVVIGRRGADGKMENLPLTLVRGTDLDFIQASTARGTPSRRSLDFQRIRPIGEDLARSVPLEGEEQGEPVARIKVLLPDGSWHCINWLVAQQNPGCPQSLPGYPYQLFSWLQVSMDDGAVQAEGEVVVSGPPRKGFNGSASCVTESDARYCPLVVAGCAIPSEATHTSFATLSKVLPDSKAYTSTINFNPSWAMLPNEVPFCPGQ